VRVRVCMCASSSEGGNVLGENNDLLCSNSITLPFPPLIILSNIVLNITREGNSEEK